MSNISADTPVFWKLWRYVKIESNEETELKFTYLMRWVELHILHDLISVWNARRDSYMQIRCATRTIYSSSSFSHVKIENPSLHTKVVLNGSSSKTVLLVVRKILCSISACQTSLILLTNKSYPTLWKWMSRLFRNTLLLRDNESPAYFDDRLNTAHVISMTTLKRWRQFEMCMLLLQTWEYMLLTICKNSLI